MALAGVVAHTPLEFIAHAPTRSYVLRARTTSSLGSQRCHLHRLDARPYQAFIELCTSASHVHSSSRAPSKAPRLLHATIGLFSCSCGSKCKTSLTLLSPTSAPKSSTRITLGLEESDR